MTFTMLITKCSLGGSIICKRLQHGQSRREQFATCYIYRHSERKISFLGVYLIHIQKRPSCIKYTNTNDSSHDYLSSLDLIAKHAQDNEAYPIKPFYIVH